MHVMKLVNLHNAAIRWKILACRNAIFYELNSIYAILRGALIVLLSDVSYVWDDTPDGAFY